MQLEIFEPRTLLAAVNEDTSQVETPNNPSSPFSWEGHGIHHESSDVVITTDQLELNPTTSFLNSPTMKNSILGILAIISGIGSLAAVTTITGQTANQDSYHPTTKDNIFGTLCTSFAALNALVGAFAGTRGTRLFLSKIVDLPSSQQHSTPNETYTLIHDTLVATTILPIASIAISGAIATLGSCFSFNQGQVFKGLMISQTGAFMIFSTGTAAITLLNR